MDVVSIDNLPSVLAEEASYAFADLLLPALLEYPTDKGWAEAENVREDTIKHIIMTMLAQVFRNKLLFASSTPEMT